ncbi:hypothetical protein SCUP234_04660 [Seiridium cupressi]
MFATLPLVLFAGLAAAKSYQIRAVQDPIFHYYLQAYPSDPSIAVMGPDTSSEYFDIDGTIQSANTTRYLNIGSETTSYKTLTFGNSSTTDAWALEGDTIITSTGSTWGRHWKRCAQWGNLQQLSEFAPTMPMLGQVLLE